MRAKTVNENINEFGRGQSPKKTIGVGEEFLKRKIIKNIMKFDTSSLNYIGMRHDYDNHDFQHMYAMDNYKWMENWMMEEDIELLQQVLDDIIERSVHFKKDLDIVASINENVGFQRNQSPKSALGIGKVTAEDLYELYQYYHFKTDWSTFHKQTDRSKHPYEMLAKQVLGDKFENMGTVEIMMDLIYDVRNSDGISRDYINELNKYMLDVINLNNFNELDYTDMPRYDNHAHFPMDDIYGTFNTLLKQ